MAAVSVLLPVHQITPLLERAVGCILAQTFADFELLIIANGQEIISGSSLAQLAALDPRIRIERLERASLAAALNHGLRVCSSDLVARMDADDWCAPERLRRQMIELHNRPGLDAVGCAFEVVNRQDEVLCVQRPPVDAREARWRLCLSNIFAHGSMMMRAAAVLAAGGYDESMSRAQDYDLWMRLGGRIGAVREVLYRYTAHDGDGYSSSEQQAALAATCMVRAWSKLPRGDAAALAPILAGALGTPKQARDARDQLSHLLTVHGPSCEGLLAWMLCEQQLAATAARGERERTLECAAAALIDQGVRDVYLWGAGAHTAFALPKLEALGLTIRGIIDDAHGGEERFGRIISEPGSVGPGEHVLISSDRHERAMWEASPALRSRGVVVHRLYG